MAELYLRCYSRGRAGAWEAFCIDLDLAVQGDSEQQVKELLEESIESYVHDALQEKNPEDRKRLLSRRAPLSARAKLGWQFFTYSLARKLRDGDNRRASFEVHCPA